MAGISLATWAALAGAGTAAYGAYSANESSKDSQRVQQAGIQAQKDALGAKPQASKAPDYAMLRGMQGMLGGSNATTLLTGASGIDPKRLNLAKSSLLGS